jgi:hypothetical protein
LAQFRHEVVRPRHRCNPRTGGLRWRGRRCQTIALAKQAYGEAKASGVDMSRGPCLGVIKPGWVADVAHDPRQPVDDDPANQCPQYRSGEADHFVELDSDGEFIRSG